MIQHHLNVKILLQGKPVNQLYVQHIWRVGPVGGPLGHYITNKDGQICDKDGRLGFNSTTPEADIRIFAQNPIARMVSTAAIWPVYVDEKVRNDSVIDIDSVDEKLVYFKLLRMATDCYNKVHRHLGPYKDRDFPWGEKGTLQELRDKKQGIQIVYPDNLGQAAPFVEPTSLATGYPLLHLKNKSQAATDSQYNSYDRLFGLHESRPEIMPHELAHALHFAQLDDPRRTQVEIDYVKYLLGSIIRSGDASHGVNQHTTPMVAYIEAFGMFSERAIAFVEYWARNQNAEARKAGFDENLQKEFIKAECKNYQNDEPYWLNIDPLNTPKSQIAKQEGTSVTYRLPIYTKANSEAAVYGAIFLDFASREDYSIGRAVEAFYKSQALSFEEYSEWVIKNFQESRGHGELHTIEKVRDRWFLETES